MTSSSVGPVHLDDAQRRARLARRHLLLPADRTDDVTAIADALMALHSSDPVSVVGSCLARMVTPAVEPVQQALHERHALIRHHAMRRTLWVAAPGTVRRMHAACTVKIARVERTRTMAMLADNGIADPGRWLDEARATVLSVLAEQGRPLSAREIGELAPQLAHPLVLSRGKAYQGVQRAHSRVLAGLGFEGTLVRTRPVGSWLAGNYAWAPMETVLPGGVTGAPERESRRDLVQGYLERYGPATTRDVAWWGGWTLADTRSALVDTAAEEVSTDTGPAWVAAGDTDPVQDPGPWAALLPGLDPTAMGWQQRDFCLPSACRPVWDANGNAGPSVWVDGRMVGAWGQAADGALRVRLLLDLPPDRRRLVKERAELWRDTLGGARIPVRFPGRIYQELTR